MADGIVPQVRRWKREYDAMIARSALGINVGVLYGQSLLDVSAAIDASGNDIADFQTDSQACQTAASAAKAKSLIQAWSLAEGPHGFSCMMVRFDGSAARNAASTPAGAMCWMLLEICQRRN